MGSEQEGVGKVERPLLRSYPAPAAILEKIGAADCRYDGGGAAIKRTKARSSTAAGFEVAYCSTLRLDRSISIRRG